MSEPFVTSQKAASFFFFFVTTNTNTHTHMQREVELNDVPETFKLLSSFSFPQGILWLCCNACCNFFYYPKTHCFVAFPQNQTFPNKLHCQFFSLLPNHSPNINVASPRWCHPGRGCDGPLLPWSGSPSPWLARPAVRVCVGGRPASGGTHNSHTRVFSALSAIKSRNCRSEFRRVAPFPPPRLQQAGVTDSVRAGAKECAN